MCRIRYLGGQLRVLTPPPSATLRILKGGGSIQLLLNNMQRSMYIKHKTSLFERMKLYRKSCSFVLDPHLWAV